MKDARQGWNAAQRARDRPLPKPRPKLEPIGDYSVSALYEHASHCCRKCGYHLCSCGPTYLRSVAQSKPLTREMFLETMGRLAPPKPCVCGYHPCVCGGEVRSR